MKNIYIKIVQVVLDRYKDRQLNLGSEAARTSLAYEIAYAIDDQLKNNE